jgi:hypothetical protein
MDKMTATNTSVDAANRARSRQEVESFKAERPERYFAYMGTGTVCAGSNVTTWMGDKLGTVQLGARAWRSNFGDRRVSFHMRAITGDVYSGIAFIDAGDYCRLRKIKS